MSRRSIKHRTLFNTRQARRISRPGEGPKFQITGEEDEETRSYKCQEGAKGSRKGTKLDTFCDSQGDGGFSCSKHIAIIMQLTMVMKFMHVIHIILPVLG